MINLSKTNIDSHRAEKIRAMLLDKGVVHDNEYLLKYAELTSSDDIGECLQRHHILPKFVFRQNGLKLDNSVENLVKLTFSNHILSHYLLYLSASDGDFKLSNAFAVSYMVGKSIKDDSLGSEWLSNMDSINKVYEDVNRRRSESMRGDANISKRADVREKRSKALKGVPKSDEQKRKQSESMKGKYAGEKAYWYGKSFSFSDETKARLKGYHSGSHNSHYGKRTPDDVRKKISESLKGKRHYTDGTTIVFAKECPDGFVPYTKGKKTDN